MTRRAFFLLIQFSIITSISFGQVNDSSIVVTDTIVQNKDSLAMAMFKDSLALNEFSITYNIIVEGKRTNMAEAYNGGLKTLYVKGKMGKLKLASLMRIQSILYYEKPSNKSKKAVLIKESGKAKYKAYLNEKQWAQFNTTIPDSLWKIGNSVEKTILDKPCYMAETVIDKNTRLTVYFVPGVKHDLLSGMEPIFNSLPGLPLEYVYSQQSLLRGKRTLSFTATNIDFKKIPLAWFKEPVKGYIVKRFNPTAKVEIIEGEDVEEENEKP